MRAGTPASTRLDHHRCRGMQRGRPAHAVLPRCRSEEGTMKLISGLATVALASLVATTLAAQPASAATVPPTQLAGSWISTQLTDGIAVGDFAPTSGSPSSGARTRVDRAHRPGRAHRRQHRRHPRHLRRVPLRLRRVGRVRLAVPVRLRPGRALRERHGQGGGVHRADRSRPRHRVRQHRSAAAARGADRRHHRRHRRRSASATTPTPSVRPSPLRRSAGPARPRRGPRPARSWPSSARPATSSSPSARLRAATCRARHHRPGRHLAARVGHRLHQGGCRGQPRDAVARVGPAAGRLLRR